MLRVGVWQKSQDNFTFGQLFSQDDFHHLLVAAIEVVEFVEGCEEVIKKDTAEKMSSRRSHTTKQLEDYGRKEKANS